MAVAKIALSLPEPLVKQIDRSAKKAGLSRSAFVRKAVERTLQESAETHLVQTAYRIYTEIGEEDAKLAESFLPLAAETLPGQTKRRRG